MNKLNIGTLAVVIGLAFSSAAMAESMSKADFKMHKEKIAAEYKAAKAACDSFSANAKDICLAEAKGKEKVGLADLEASYKPSPKTHYEAREARAEADYAVAKEKCDDKDGNAKDVCVKEAKAALAAAKADAKTQMKTTDAKQMAAEKSADARKEGAADKRDADYAVVKEKCDAFAGDAKDRCLSDAKAHYGK